MNDILSILLPKFIRDKIEKQESIDIMLDQGEVSVMFCDI